MIIFKSVKNMGIDRSPNDNVIYKVSILPYERMIIAVKIKPINTISL